jgi:hypothetical protein
MGLGFTGLMLGLSWVQGRYTSFKASNNEEFTSASRSVKPGLVRRDYMQIRGLITWQIASGIVSCACIALLWRSH